MRDSAGRIQWANGRRAGVKAVAHLIEQGEAIVLDADLFGDRARGQTIGRPG